MGTERLGGTKLKLKELRIGKKKVDIKKLKYLNHPVATHMFWDFEFHDGSILVTTEPVRFIYEPNPLEGKQATGEEDRGK